MLLGDMPQCVPRAWGCRTALISLLLASVSATFEPTATLPSLLQFNNGTAVTTAVQWAARRDELKTLTQEHILGRRHTFQLATV